MLTLNQITLRLLLQSLLSKAQVKVDATSGYLEALGAWLRSATVGPAGEKGRPQSIIDMELFMYLYTYNQAKEEGRRYPARRRPCHHPTRPGLSAKAGRPWGCEGNNGESDPL